MTRADDRPDVVVIGGGLAGISAALELAEAGRAVTLVEGRPWLGGATCSFQRRGLSIDNGQHLFLRCCTAYRDLLARLGVAASCVIQDRLDLTILAPGGPAGPAHAILRRSGLPPPAHLTRALARFRLLSVTDRAKVAAAVMTLRFADLGTGNDRNLAGWLADHGQHERARTMLWDWLCALALNAQPERADLSLAASTIRTTALAGRDHADIGVSAVPFSQLHSAPAAALLGRLGVTIRLGTRAVAVELDQAGGYQVAVSGGAGGPDDLAGATELIRTAAVVLAVPPGEAIGLAAVVLPGAAARWSLLRTSPVVSLHVLYDRPVTRLPFAVVAGSPVRWVIDKTSAAGLHAGQYLAASIPAADRYVDTPATQLRERALPLLERLFPESADASVADFFVTKERRATISHEPGVGRLRAVTSAGPRGLAVAGGWTATGWPDTMEGAVRSGQAAARKLVADLEAGPVSASTVSAGTVSAGTVSASTVSASTRSAGTVPGATGPAGDGVAAAAAAPPAGGR
jgi:squalene-associated FAD-dependent desaturase